MKKNLKIITERVHTVGDLIEALSNIPKSYYCDPFGDPSVAIAVDEEHKRVFIDSIDWIDEYMEED
jgi:hypothetical protein